MAQQHVAADASADVEVDLPRAMVQRLVRARAAAVFEPSGPRVPGVSKNVSKPGGNVQVAKDALHALQESAKVFINYVASTANDCAHENKRVTILPEDVFRALGDLEFTEFVAPLRQYLEAHKAMLKEKPAAKKKVADGGTAKKRKTAAEAAPQAAGEQHAAQGDAAQPEAAPAAGGDAMQPNSMDTGSADVPAAPAQPERDQGHA